MLPRAEADTRQFVLESDQWFILGCPGTAFSDSSVIKEGRCVAGTFEVEGEDMEELGDLEGQFRRGEFHAFLDWTRRNIHAEGSRFRPKALVERVTGTPPSLHAPMQAQRANRSPSSGTTDPLPTPRKRNGL